MPFLNVSLLLPVMLRIHSQMYFNTFQNYGCACTRSTLHSTICQYLLHDTLHLIDGARERPKGARAHPLLSCISAPIWCTLCVRVCVCVISAFVLIQPPKQSTANTHTRVRVVRSMSECTSHGRSYRAASVNTPNYNTMRARISRDSVYSRAGLFGRRLLVDISNHTEH